AGTVTSILSILTNLLPPTINLNQVDPDCDINHVTETRSKPVDTALVNCLGFGSRNSALVLKQP
ncbi:MAG: hypothetical protein ABEK50_00820, partial [bacterium]